MQMLIPKISKKVVTILLTLGVIGLVYVFYFFVYVANNEKAYQAKAFRILDKIGQNIKEKHENNKKNVQSIVKIVEEKGLLESLKASEKDMTELNEEIQKLQSDLVLEKKSRLIAQNRVIGLDKDELGLPNFYSRVTEISANLAKKQHELDEINKETAEEYSRLYNQKLSEYAINNGFNILSVDTTLVGRGSHTTNDFEHLFYQETTKANDKKPQYLLFETPLKKFITPLLRTDVFDELIIIREGDENITYQTFANKVLLQQVDTLISKHAGNTSIITIEETTYKIFFYNLAFDNNEKWVVAGCIQEDRYLTEIRSISFWVIINSGLIVILLIVGMPILKLALMSSIERLHTRNVLLAGLSIVLGAPLIILSFLIAFNYYGYDIIKTDQNLKKLSQEVSDKFNNELASTYNQLSTYDTIINHEATKLAPASSIGDINNHDSLSPKIYKNFNEVFWMDSSGMQRIQLTPSKKASSLILLKNREYFKHAIDNQLWKHPVTGVPLYIQSITSWSTGDHEIAISKPGINPAYPVAAITARFKSVIDAIVPMGYGFSIISPSGEVQIHSNSKKNLQENFIEECKNNADIRSAIYSKIALTTTIDYLGRKHRAFITPIKGMPLYLVVFFDLENLKARISEIWSTTLLILLGSFGAVALLILIIFVSRFKPTKLKIKQFYFDWMIPHNDHLSKYKRLIISNLLVLLMVIIFNQHSGNEQINIVFRLFILPSIAFTFIHLQLNAFIARKMKILFLLLSGIYLVAINLFFYEFLGSWNPSHLWVNLLFQGLVIGVYLPITKLDKWVNYLNVGNLRSTYSIFLVTWLLASNIAPVIYLYKTSYAKESEIWTKYSMLDLSRNVKKKINSSDSATANNLKKEITESKPINYQGLYYKFLNAKFLKDDKGFTADSLNQSFDSVVFYLRPGYNNAIIENRGLIYSKASDESFHWKQSADTLLLSLGDKNSSINLAQGVDKIYFVSYKDSNTYTLLLFFVLIILLYLLYRIISFCVNKIYGIEFSDYIQKFGYKLLLTKKIITKNNTILIGLPGCGKTALLKKQYKGANDFFVVDCMTIHHTDAWDKTRNELSKDIYNTIVIDNFEYNNDDPKTNSIKLKLLEELLHKNRHIIVSSEVHPSEILKAYNRSIDENIPKETRQKLENEVEIWHHIFSSFIEAYMPLEEKKLPCNIELLQKELKYGTYLQNLCGSIEKEIKENMDHEDIILEIQQYAKSYYYALWNALTKREKFAVYDVAKDRFMNTRNKPVINSLLKKGLLRYDQNLHLMNESFTNFVLSVVNKNEALKMDLEVSKKGKWTSIRLAIILVLIGSIALMGFGQPGFFKNLNTIMIAITGVMGIIPALSGGYALTQKIK